MLETLFSGDWREPGMVEIIVPLRFVQDAGGLEAWKVRRKFDIVNSGAWALLPASLTVYNRGDWDGAVEAFSRQGLLDAVHGLYTPWVNMFFGQVRQAWDR